MRSYYYSRIPFHDAPRHLRLPDSVIISTSESLKWRLRQTRYFITSTATLQSNRMTYSYTHFGFIIKESAVFNPSSKQPQSNSNGLRNRTGLPQLAKRQLINLDEVDQSLHKTKKMPLIGHSHGYPASRRECLLNDFYPEPQTPTNRPLPHHPIPQTGSLNSARATYHASESRPILAAISADADTCQIVLAIEDHKSHRESIFGNPNCAKHVISSKASLEEVRQRLLTVIGCRCSRCFRYSASKNPHIDPRVAKSLTPISRRYATPEPSRSPPGAKSDEESTANTPKNRINNAQRNPRTPISPQPTNTESRTPKSNSRIWAKAAPIQWFEAQFENPKGPRYLSGHPQHPHVVKYKRLMHEDVHESAGTRPTPIAEMEGTKFNSNHSGGGIGPDVWSPF